MATRNTKKWVDKKNAQTFQVVYRSHEDSKFYDEAATEHVLVPVNPKNSKVMTKSALEKQLQQDLEEGKMRNNEGEAALYGITYDDSKYDYMQHLKPIGTGEGVFIPKRDKKEEKEKINEIIFKDEDIVADVVPSKTKINYQDMQNIPDEISGFKPDMDPKLREVLEALEDEAYVDDDDAVFDDLLAGGERSQNDDDYYDDDEWDMDKFDDEGYNTDEFEKEGDQGWEAGFRKFKELNKHKANEWDSDDDFEDEEEDDFVGDLPVKGELITNSANAANKKKNKTKERKKKGSMTDTSSFSMSSSALFRSEGLTLLDDRFEKLQLNYSKRTKEQPKDFEMEGQRQDFESLLDDFLENHELEKGGRKIVRKDATKAKVQRAADSVSKGKLARKRNKDIN